jgi:hypothetical protein
MPVIHDAKTTFANQRDMQISEQVTATRERSLPESVQHLDRPHRLGYLMAKEEALSEVRTIVEEGDMVDHPHDHERKFKALKKGQLSPRRQHRPGRYRRRNAIVPSSWALWDIPSSWALWDIPEQPSNHCDG